MAAGLGFKTFTTGEVLTAADTNGYLMQGVLVFASSAARAAAITSPQEGQYSYLKDTNSTEYYDGAAWIAAPIGDITGVTAGVGITGGGTSGTVTITNDMATTITASGDIVIGTGSGTYDNLPIGTTGQLLTADTTVSPYKVKWATPAAAGVKGCSVKLTAAQATVSNTNYTVLFGGEDFDTDGYHSTSVNTGRITIPTGLGGYYLFTISNRQTTTSAQQNSISLHVNGSVIGYGTSNGNFQSVVNTGGIGITLSGSIVYYATAGDYFTCVAYLGGAALSVDNATFQAIYLGA